MVLFLFETNFYSSTEFKEITNFLAVQILSNFVNNLIAMLFNGISAFRAILSDWDYGACLIECIDDFTL